MKQFKVKNKHAEALVSQLGAQLLEWTPVGHEPVLWVSPAADLDQKRAIRGGVPICWPWFGLHPASCFPRHGFARNQKWQYISNEDINDMSCYEFKYTNKDFECFPYVSSVYLKLSIGQELKIELTTQNESDSPFCYTQALHTYFNVGDVSKVQVEGLENKKYIDTVGEKKDQQFEQKGPVYIDQEVDRIYLGVENNILLTDKSLNREICISNQGGTSVVVWNPWHEKAQRMGDMGPEDSFRNMLCIETANTADDCIELEPGQTHTLAATIKVRKL